MTATIKFQPQGFSVKYPKTSWRVVFVEDSAGKFFFRLYGEDFRFEPRDRYRYPSHDDARRAVFCFLELMKRIERSRMKLSILAEIGILKFPQEAYRSYEIWLLVDRIRYSWEIVTASGFCFRCQYWYKHPDTAISKAKTHIDRELAVSQIQDIIGWV